MSTPPTNFGYNWATNNNNNGGAQQGGSYPFNNNGNHHGTWQQNFAQQNNFFQNQPPFPWGGGMVPPPMAMPNLCNMPNFPVAPTFPPAMAHPPMQVPAPMFPMPTPQQQQPIVQNPQWGASQFPFNCTNNDHAPLMARTNFPVGPVAPPMVQMQQQPQLQQQQQKAVRPAVPWEAGLLQSETRDAQQARTTNANVGPPTAVYKQPKEPQHEIAVIDENNNRPSVPWEACLLPSETRDDRLLARTNVGVAPPPVTQHQQPKEQQHDKSVAQNRPSVSWEAFFLPSETRDDRLARTNAEVGPVAPPTAVYEQPIRQEQLQEEEDEDDPYPDFPFDSTLLTLHEEETEWALTIKEAIGDITELEVVSFSDYMIANLAIVGQGDLDWAIQRAHRMQKVRKEYNILGTFEDGKRAIRDFIDLFPHLVMAFQYNPLNGKHMIVFDGTSRLKAKWKKHKNVVTTIRGAYYIAYAEMMSFEAMREGGIHMFDFEGYTLGVGMPFVHECVKITNSTVGAFPSAIKQSRFYHTAAFANMLLKMIIPYIPKDIAEKHKIGCQFSGGSLGSFYRVPSAQSASDRAYLNLCTALKIRMESEKAFSLDRRD